MKRDARRAPVADHLPHLGHKRRRCASCARKGGRGATRAPSVNPTVSRATRATSIRIRQDRQFVRLLHVCLVSMERARQTSTVKSARKAHLAAESSCMSTSARSVQPVRGGSSRERHNITTATRAPADTTKIGKVAPSAMRATWAGRNIRTTSIPQERVARNVRSASFTTISQEAAMVAPEGTFRESEPKLSAWSALKVVLGQSRTRRPKMTASFAPWTRKTRLEKNTLEARKTRGKVIASA